MKRTVIPNEKYGYLTVLQEVEKDRFSHRQYLVRCRCGKEYVTQKSALFTVHPKCKECGKEGYHNRVVTSYVGTVLNGFEIIREIGKNKRGAILYECRCLRCGSKVSRTTGALSVRKGAGCEKCMPDYGFDVFGEVAIGHLPDGTDFIIDTKDRTQVSLHHWRIHEDGYVVCSDHGKNRGVKLHHFVLGISKNSGLIVDHINRDRLDCRASNLRIVTPQQNSMNRSIQSNNTSGYVGVSSYKVGNRYVARIGLNYRMIYVFTSEDPVECAQAYNLASKLLFGEFAGHRNEVPDASEEIRLEVYRKCAPFMKQAEKATSRTKFTHSA